MKCFGKLVPVRTPYDVDVQATIRGNRDTLYSWGVFDLSSPLTVTLPKTKGRYQSLMTVSQDEYITAHYGPKRVTFTQKSIGTRYVVLVVRTFMDPNNKADLKAAHLLQDAIRTKQADPGKLELPNWDVDQVVKMREAINVVVPVVSDTSKMFGSRGEVDPVYHVLGAAFGWGGLPGKEALYRNFIPRKNDGKTAYTVTVKNVPVKAFWSVTLYNDKGFFTKNKYNAYSFNSVTAKKNKNGSITIHFGGDPKQPNFLPLVKGWNYIVRQYQPRKALLDGSWTFPGPVEVK